MPLLNARNKELVGGGREVAILANAADAGATTLTVDDNSGIANGDLLIIGELGTEGAEIVKVNAAVTFGRSLTIAGSDQGDPPSYSGGTDFAHAAGTPVYRIDFDQVEFSQATTLTGSKTVLDTVTIQPDDLYTRYDDTINTTGFAFFRFKNSVSGAFSPYSAGVDYAGYADYSLHKIRERVRRYLADRNGKPRTFLDDDEIDDAIYDAEKEIAREFRLPQLEKVASWSAVAYQREYDLTDAASDFWGFVYVISYDTQPLIPMDDRKFHEVNWDSDSTGDPTHFIIRNKKFRSWPVRTSAAQTTALNGAVASTDTTITVDSTSGFPDKGRVKINDEVIEYDRKTSTTFVLASTDGRGMEGTTAAAHSNDDTVTNRDFVMVYYARPTKMTTEISETEIDDPELVAVTAAQSLAFLRMPDDKALMDRLDVAKEKRMARFREAFKSKFAEPFGRIKRKHETLRQDYWPSLRDPRNLTGA